jgi:tetratricopeptide (TPR) repeat protein
MWSYWRALALVVPALFASLGCQGQLSPQARQCLQDAYTASAAGDNRAVIADTDVFLHMDDRARRADEAYYLRGLARYGLGDRAGAQADLSEALGRTQMKELRAKSAAALGDLAWDADEMQTAERMYGLALNNLQKDQKPADHAHYRLGCVLQRLGRWEEADDHFNKVVYFFSGSKLAERAGRRLNARDWTIQVAAFEGKSRAEAVVRELRDRNLPAVAQPIVAEGRLTFVVQVGHYPTYEQATASLGAVRQHKPDAYVIPTR